MQLLQRISHITFVGLAALMTIGCAKGQEPARQALDQIRGVLERAAIDGRNYWPEKVIVVQLEAAKLSASFDRKDYSAVIAGAPMVLNDANSLLAAVAAKKKERVEELARQWSTLDATFPPLVAAVKLRIDTLSKSGLRRKGVNLYRAEASIAVGSALWDKAETAFESGQLEDAVALLKVAKPKTDEAAAELQMTFPVAD